MSKPVIPVDREQSWRIGVYTGGEVIGDGLWKLPFIRALRSAFPHAHITWIARSHTVYATTLAPVVDGFLDEVLDNSGVARRISCLVTPRFKGERFDLIIDTQRTIWRALYMHRLSRGLVLAPAADYLLSQVKPPAGHQPTRHLGQLMVDWVHWLTGEPVVLDRSLPLPSSLVAAAARALPANDAIYVGFVPGAGDTRKCWPLASYIAVAQALTQDNPAVKPVFLLGPDEVSWRDEIAHALPHALFPEQEPETWEGTLAGPLRAIALAKHLTAAVSNDCGTGHMLAAGDCSLLSLFGPTEAAKFKPLNNAPSLVLEAQDFGTSDAMEQIPVDAVTTTLKTLL